MQEAGWKPVEAYPLAKQYLQKALALDPSSPSALYVRGWVATSYDWDWRAAEEALLRSLKGNPADPDAHHAYSHYLIAMGRFQKSLAESERAIELDRVNARMIAHLTWHYLFTGSPEKAFAPARRALEIDPHNWLGLFFLRQAYENTGGFENAIDTLQSWPDVPQGFRANLRSAFRRNGERGYWQAWLEYNQGQRKTRYVSAAAFVGAATLAANCARLGRTSEALRWLNVGTAERDSGMVYLKCDPAFHSILNEPGFQDLVRRVGLP